jgi:hypothetical protein
LSAGKRGLPRAKLLKSRRGLGYGYDSNTRHLQEKKDDRRRRGAASPDQWDAVALTFAEPVDPRFRRKIEYPPSGVA